MRVLLSIGPGRLHFIPAAQALVRQGLDLTLILGWGVSPRMARWSRRLGARSMPLDVAYRSCAVAELLTQAAVRGARLLHLPADGVEAMGWQGFGWASRRHIRQASIFHVRSGVGRGGAIRKARRLGMKVLVDHSIAHPTYLAQQVGDGYPASSRFWHNVLQDCQEADLVLVNSDFVRETFLQQGFPAAKLRVVYLGVEAEYGRLRQPKGDERQPLRLLFVGHFGRRKGAEALVEAMRLLETRGVAATLDVVGSVETPLPQTPGNIAFHRHLPPARVRDFLRQADLFVFPTLAEGCARSVMEAMAAGVCVVTTPASGAPITDGETGFLVPVQDAPALAERILWLADQRPLLDRIGAAASELVTSAFTWDAYASNVARLYQELLDM